MLGMLGMLGTMAGCASSAPKVFGAYNDLAPKVEQQTGERIPLHLTVSLNRPANVAVFLVTPGRGSLLLFPADSTSRGFVDAGSHLIETSLARSNQPLSDTSRLVRRPVNPNGGRGAPQGRNAPNGRFPRDSIGFSPTARGYLLVYASQEPLPYDILHTRVNGISVPIDDQDALNTVQKLIRESTHTQGPWAAYATEFPK
jgi:hypothetical protein